jgi:hypothetical protein
MDSQRVLLPSLLRSSSWTALSIIPDRPLPPTLEAVIQLFELSSFLLQKPPISTIPYPQEATGISQVGESIVVGTLMVTIVSASARNPRTNLGLLLTRRNWKRRNRRSLETLVLGLGLAVAKQMEINMNGLSLVVKRVTNNPGQWGHEV